MKAMTYEAEWSIVAAVDAEASTAELLRLKRRRDGLRPLSPHMQRRLRQCSETAVVKVRRYLEEIELQLKGYMSLPTPPVAIAFSLDLYGDPDHNKLDQLIRRYRDRTDPISRRRLEELEHQRYEVEPNWTTLAEALYSRRYNDLPQWMEFKWTADVPPEQFLQHVRRTLEPLLEPDATGLCRALEDLKYRCGWTYADIPDLTRWEFNLRADFPLLK